MFCSFPTSMNCSALWDWLSLSAPGNMWFHTFQITWGSLTLFSISASSRGGMVFAGKGILQNHCQNIIPNKKREVYKDHHYLSITWNISRNITQNIEWKQELVSHGKSRYFKFQVLQWVRAEQEKGFFAKESSEMRPQAFLGSTHSNHGPSCPMSS